MQKQYNNLELYLIRKKRCLQCQKVFKARFPEQKEKHLCVHCTVMNFGCRLFGRGFIRDVENHQKNPLNRWTSELTKKEYEGLFL